MSNMAAVNVIDGIKSGPDTSTYCSSTGYESSPWWRLDLLDVYDISTVVITARSDCCAQQINKAEIRIGNSLENNGNNNPICATVNGIPVGLSVLYSCNGLKGRYVNVLMPIVEHLSFCELEVYSSGTNLALKGNAIHSSTFNNHVAANAIDQKRYAPGTALYCSATLSESNPWWRLDLLDIYKIGTVIISNRGDCCTDQTNGAEIHIGNSLDNNPICAVISGLPVHSTVSYSCNGMEGRYVSVIMPTVQNLTLCEVEVYGTGN
ncbi:hypothetical protein IRJ41_001912 [Triplophysa rosa]|uniref:Fucolectin tachylectin-4 pentraxin-1 domain-containing protein n=1 Tax=Triplophysa rosa TaxID=992332 RepID=A0A9W7X4X9_TRIRA|nr:hypothetical protein IRJ41_001912 [Triplophysa rosa]